jgi:CHAD domain-containing protein
LPTSNSIAGQKTGFAYWADRVLEEHSNAGGALPAEPIHDLRVSLRRCIVIAGAMRDLDPTCDWKAVRKTARRLFQRLGALRDTQVLTEWIEKLAAPGDAPPAAFLDILNKQHEQDRIDARAALREFDRKEWRAWRREFSKDYRRAARDRATCESLVLEILEGVQALNRRAQRSGSMAAYHRLRVVLKKFRYAVENFLPALYPVWESDLKVLQDLLGEIHDLTVLDEVIVKNQALFDATAAGAWRAKIEEQRASRLAEYREKTAGKTSPLRMWRDSLPREDDLRAAGLARLGTWASFVTPDFLRARRIARLALQLYDGLANIDLIGAEAQFDERSVLHAAALLQDSGRFKKARAWHKESFRMIRDLAPPPGWSKKDLEFAAVVARFHRRALPYPDRAGLIAYELPLRQALIRVAAVLRLANALNAKPYRAIRRLQIEKGPEYVAILAESFREGEPLHARLTVALGFLEFALQRSVRILPPGARPMLPQIVRADAQSDAA